MYTIYTIFDNDRARKNKTPIIFSKFNICALGVAGMAKISKTVA